MKDDETQLKKAQIKVEAAKQLMNSFISINNILEKKQMKPYIIELGYKDFFGYTKFYISVIRGNINPEIILELKYSLNNKEIGLNLLNSILNSYVQNTDTIYSGFCPSYDDNDEYYIIRSNNEMSLKYSINNSIQKDSLEAYNNILNNNLLKKQMRR